MEGGPVKRARLDDQLPDIDGAKAYLKATIDAARLGQAADGTD